MVKCRLYVIKDINSGLFVTEYDSLEPLGSVTRFFKSRSDAKKAMNYTNGYGISYNPILNTIVMKHFEDAWNEHITDATFKTEKNKYRLVIRRVILECQDEMD